MKIANSKFPCAGLIAVAVCPRIVPVHGDDQPSDASGDHLAQVGGCDECPTGYIDATRQPGLPGAIA